MVIPECPAKAAEFDKKHGLTGGKVKNAKKHSGAKELAEQYTPGLSVATGQGVVRAYVWYSRPWMRHNVVEMWILLQ